MGFPITSYSIFQAFDETYEGASIVWDKQFMLNQFALFGLILHDPEVHHSFHHTLRKQFEQLDYDTGSRFLFFALTDPPENWSQTDARVEHMRKTLYWQIPEDSRLDIKRESLLAFYLAYRLGIPFKDLPVIILTNDLSLKTFTAIRTNETILMNQMHKIGYMCHQRGGQKIDLDKIEPYLNERVRRNPPNVSLVHELDRPLSTILVDLFSFVVPEQSQSYRDAEQRVTLMLGSWRALMQATEQETENWATAEQELLAMLGMMAVSKPGPTETPLVVLDAGCEQESQKFMNTFMAIRELPIFSEGIFDLSPLVLLLSKIIELEFNLSLVQQFRQAWGIEMPKYFNRYAGAVGAAVVEIQQPNTIVEIDVNGIHPSSFTWRQLTQWQIIVLIRHFHRINRLPDLPMDIKTLTDYLDFIRLARNPGMHTAVLDDATYQSVLDRFTAINAIFRRLNEIKQALRSDSASMGSR